MKLTVIICTLQRPGALARLLESLEAQSVQPDQLIVVDASADHGTQKVVQEYARRSRTKVDYYRTERGLTRQRNFGLARAEGEVIGFLDDDVVLEKDYLAEILKPFQADRTGRVGGATGYILAEQSRRSWGRRLLGELRARIHGPRCLAQHYGIRLIPREPFTGLIPVRYVSGCNMFFRREVFARERFNEWFKGYGLGEDREFGLRVARHWQVVAVGGARLRHLHELAGRCAYRKLGRMSVENPVRVLAVARQRHLYPHGFMLMLRQFLGTCITGLMLLGRGRLRAALTHVFGGLEGVVAAARFVLGPCPCPGPVRCDGKGDKHAGKRARLADQPGPDKPAGPKGRNA